MSESKNHTAILNAIMVVLVLACISRVVWFFGVNNKLDRILEELESPPAEVQSDA